MVSYSKPLANIFYVIEAERHKVPWGCVRQRDLSPLSFYVIIDAPYPQKLIYLYNFKDLVSNPKSLAIITTNHASHSQKSHRKVLLPDDMLHVV